MNVFYYKIIKVSQACFFKRIVFCCLILLSLVFIAKAQLNCTNVWLNNQNTLAGVQIGDLDVPGNTITVEALINSSGRYPGGRLYTGDIVSKHKDPTDVNYLLRPSSAEITTTNGYFITPTICDINLNKTYHVAMVYDGSQLKFYRNGFLMAKVNCTGNLFQNNYLTMIGEFANYPGILPTAFIGYINEVRIWNVARTQAQIQNYMNTTLPNPATQTGLLAYYTFNSLVNLQGNAAWNGTLIGNAQIQKNNPTCSTYIVDSCSLIINPVLQKSNDTSVCLGQNAQMSANVTNSIDYSWSPVSGLSNTAISNPLANPKTTTVYYVTVHANAPGGTIVTLRDSIKISVWPLPTIQTINDTAICLGSSLQLKTQGALSYSWFPVTGLSNPGISNPIASPLIGTKYFVSGSDLNACIATDSVFINLLSLPTIIKSNDTSICIGGVANITALGGNGYQWSPVTGLSNNTIRNPVASPNVTTRYNVAVTGSNGCSNSDSILITVSPKPTFNLQPQSYSLCIGDSVSLTASGGSNYEWLVSSGIPNVYSPAIIVQPSVSTTYPIKIFDKVCNVLDTLHTTVIVNPLPVISISKSNDINCTVGSARLSAFGGTNYSWSPVIGLSDPAISNPIVQIIQSAKYTVTVTSSKGCIATDTMTVNVFNNSGNLYLLPNAFTPNGDGLNDCFGIKGWGLMTSLEFTIYNRWGEKVFYTTDPAKCWNGYYKSYPQPAGTYVYYIKAKTLCGDVERKGSLVLIR